MFQLRLALLLGVALGGAAPALAQAVVRPAACLEPIAGGELPEILEWSRDVRFAGEGELYLSSRQQGVFKWRPGTLEAALWAARGYGRDQVYLPDQLATTAEEVVVGSALFAFGSGKRAGRGLSVVFPFEEIADLDAHGARLAILGAQRSENGEYAPEGALAWTGKIGADPATFTPLFLSEKGPHAPPFARCGQLRTGAIRYLADGSLFLVPGVEGGAYLFAPDGKLERAFAADQLDYDSGCPFDAKKADDYARDELGRWQWINTRKVVDEILPLPDGRIGLVRREWREGRPHFELLRLSRDGAVDRCALPIETDQPYARIKGDVQDGKLVFLVVQEGFRPTAVVETNLLTGATEQLPPVLHPAGRTRFYTFAYRR